MEIFSSIPVEVDIEHENTMPGAPLNSVQLGDESGIPEPLLTEKENAQVLNTLIHNSVQDNINIITDSIHGEQEDIRDPKKMEKEQLLSPNEKLDFKVNVERQNNNPLIEKYDASTEYREKNQSSEVEVEIRLNEESSAASVQEVGVEKKPKAQDVTEEIVQKFYEEKESLDDSLFQEQIAHLDINYFFSREYSSKYLLETFPKLRELYQINVPIKMNAYTFWIKFMLFVYEEIERKDSEVVKVDYHSLNRYIVSSILSFVKVFFVIIILRHYDAPTFLYIYPVIWFVFGILILLRAVQVQRKNNIIAAKLKEEGIELKEMESV